MQIIRLTASLLFFLCLFLQNLESAYASSPLYRNIPEQASLLPQQTNTQQAGSLLLQTPASRLLQTALAGKVLRLHVIANDDSDTSQKIKYLVRDALSEALSSLAEDFDNKEEAIAYLQNRLTKLEQIANDVLAEQGAAYSALVTIDRRFFPMKAYGKYLFPEGTYDALCITLGKGEGQNWWCLAFPNLCFIENTCVSLEEEDGSKLKILLTDEEYESILKQKPTLVYRFRLLEWWKTFFR